MPTATQVPTAAIPGATPAVVMETPAPPPTFAVGAPIIAALRSAESVPQPKWVVVAGSDTDLQSAESEVNRAASAGYNGLAVYHWQKLFATTIGSFPTEFDAQSAQVSVRAKIRDSAFVVNVSAWCPGVVLVTQATPDRPYSYFDCGN